jgi:hypothetical protein
MAKAELKTKQTDADVGAFLARIKPVAKRADAEALVALFKEVTGYPPRMWGPSIIGFGSYHYKYDSGHEGDMCRAGFSPRKANISIYLTGGYNNPATQAKLEALRARLGKHKTGKACLYINRLSDVDIAVLKEMIETDLAYVNERYPI